MLVLLPTAAAAQPRPTAPQAKPLRRPAGPPKLARVYFGASVAGSATNSDFNQDVRFTLFAEEATIKGPISVARGPHFQGHVGFRLWRRLGVGASVSYFESEGEMRADYRLPHPFLVAAPREVSGEASASRQTTDVHLHVLLGLVASPRWHVVVAGGPSMSLLTQQLGPDRFTYQFVFPFSAITLNSRNGTSTGRGIGAHAGVSMTRLLGRRWGVLGDVRVSSTKAELATLDTTVRIQTGGAQVGLGLRLHF
jgi:hypothetical protein